MFVLSDHLRDLMRRPQADALGRDGASGDIEMRNTKHTRGPWSLNEEGDPQALSGDLICMMTDGVNGEGKANARLIAAAPDMLAALRSAHMDLVAVDRHKVCTNVIAKIEAVIAKAEGRASLGGAARIEPVAWRYRYNGCWYVTDNHQQASRGFEITPLYAGAKDSATRGRT